MESAPCAWLELLPAWALGALEAAEGRAVEDHLEGPCAECAGELGRIRRDLEALAASPWPVAPPPTARRRLLAAARARPRASGADSGE